MDEEKDILCKLMGNRESCRMSLKWCDLAQQVDICKGCDRNQGRAQSNWQKAQGKEHGKD